MVKSLIDVVVPGSLRLADEFMLPLVLTVAISLVAGLVGALDIGQPAPMMSMAPMASANTAGCASANWSEAKSGVILVSTQGRRLAERCGL